ncbi:23S rRNA (uracil(1939)-C(5))-methyltransferase, partial [Oleiphilus sp. HI0118]
MARRRRKKLPQEPIECEISGGLSHEGRGIAKLDGKTQFIDAALPGERVMAQYVEQRGKFDELKTVEVLEASAERVTPPCAAAEICGGCSLQHMDTDAQIQFKEATLRDHFKHFGELEPEEWIAPMTGPTLGYRGKARLGVRYVSKKESVLVGFREKRNSFLADMQQCEVLNPKVGHHLLDLRELVAGLSVYRELPQFEVALGEDAAALVVRHMAPLTEDDTAKLVAFGQAQGFHIYLQPKGVDTVHRIWPESASKDEDRLHYTLDTPDGQSVKLAFHPMDFTQVNAEINKKMVRRALEWLDV